MCGEWPCEEMSQHFYLLLNSYWFWKSLFWGTLEWSCELLLHCQCCEIVMQGVPP